MRRPDGEAEGVRTIVLIESGSGQSSAAVKVRVVGHAAAHCGTARLTCLIFLMGSMASV